MAFALARDQVAFIDQLLVSQHDGDAAHTEFGGQFTTGWDSGVGFELPVQNGRDQHFSDLSLERQVARGVALKQLLPHGSVQFGVHGLGCADLG